MNRAQTLAAPACLLPLARPLMTGEVLDAAFRLFRAGLLRCLPYSGLAVVVLELPALYATFLSSGTGVLPVAGLRDRTLVLVIALLLGVLLFGVIMLRLYAISRCERPRFRVELAAALRRWPGAVLASLGALGFPVLLYVTGSLFNLFAFSEAAIVLAIPLLWPTALLVTALPMFWGEGRGPIGAIVGSIRISRRRTWRIAGALLATSCMVAVFYIVATIVVGILGPMFGSADLFMLATVKSMLTLVIGALGVPFVLSVLIVLHADLALRERERSAGR